MIPESLRAQALHQDGIWQLNAEAEVSYPSLSYDLCYQVEDNSYWFQHRNRLIYHFVNQYLNEGIFLDIGGGNGCVTKHLQNKGVSAVLLEPGPSGCVNAQERGVANVVLGTLEEWGQGHPVAFAGAFDVVEHIEDDQAFVRQIYDTLLPGGYFLMTIPALNWLWSHADVRAGHFRRYTRNTAQALVGAQGFNVVYSTYVFEPLVPLIFLRRSVPFRLGLYPKARTLEAAQNEHQAKGRGKIAQWLISRLDKEYAKIAVGRSINRGSSVLVLCQKT